MSSWIALGVGVDANKLQFSRLQAGFLHQFAPAGIFDPFALIDETAGQRIRAFERLIFSLDKNNAAGAVDDNAVGGEEGCFGWWHGKVLQSVGRFPGTRF